MQYILKTDTKTFCQREQAPKNSCSARALMYCMYRLSYMLHMYSMRSMSSPPGALICSMRLKCLLSLCCNTCCMCLLCLICHEYHIDLRRYIHMYIYMSTTLTYVCTMPRTLSPYAPCLGLEFLDLQCFNFTFRYRSLIVFRVLSKPSFAKKLA